MTVTVATLADRVLRRLGVAIVPVAERSASSATIAPALIATHALQELGVIASDETPSAADQEIALEKVGAVQDSLTSQGISFWDVSAVPFGISEEMTKMTAAQLASTFGKQGDLAAYQAMEGRVRHYTLVQRAPDLATEAVMTVHQQLDAMGLMRWSVFDIPDAVAEAYVQRASAILAPSFGQQADPAANAESHRAFVRYTALPASDAPTPAVYF